MWLFRSLRDNQRGAVLVEAAFVLPMLIMLTVGIWSTARAWNIHNVLDHAAREGARHGATVDPWDGGSSTQTIIDTELGASSVAPANVSRCVYEGTGTSCGVTATTSEHKVIVQLSHPNVELNFVFFRFNVTLQAAAVARWEGDV